jgi:hypothetical protein
MERPRQAELAALLSEAEAAHAEYEASALGGVFDREWPRWYATYLYEHGVARLLPERISADQLASRLAECDESYRRDEPAIGWEEYYAARLAGH